MEAAELIEHTGREALVELRHCSARSAAARARRSTARRGSTRVESLVERARAAGLPVKLTVEGDAGRCPPGVDMAAYRLVQEALTNTIKHAGAAHARRSRSATAARGRDRGHRRRRRPGRTAGI